MNNYHKFKKKVKQNLKEHVILHAKIVDLQSASLLYHNTTLILNRHRQVLTQVDSINNLLLVIKPHII